MDASRRQEYIDRLITNLPMLRKKMELTQKDFAGIIGMSSYSILALEKKQRKMTWNTFLSIILVFMRNEEIRQILSALNILTDELLDFIEGKNI